jgi:predicted RNA-binding protein with PIN domain
MIVLVDGNNVIGSVPDGWWRDRPAAARRLLTRLQCLQAHTDDDLVLVLDVADMELPEGDHAGVAVRYATRRGPNAADDRIRDLVDELGGYELEVVTSDRTLADDVRSTVRVRSAKSFLSRLKQAGC